MYYTINEQVMRCLIRIKAILKFIFIFLCLLLTKIIRFGIIICACGSLAQLVEHLTLNQGAQGSSP